MHAFNDIRFLGLTLVMISCITYTIYKHYKVKNDTYVWWRVVGMVCLYILGLVIFVLLPSNSKFVI